MESDDFKKAVALIQQRAEILADEYKVFQAHAQALGMLPSALAAWTIEKIAQQQILAEMFEREILALRDRLSQ